MKKTILKTSIATLVVMSIFISCLGGDSHGKFDAANSIGYIYTSEKTFTNYAFTNSGGYYGYNPISSPEITAKTSGNFYEMSYSIDTRNTSGQVAPWIATNVKFLKQNENPIPTEHRMASASDLEKEVMPSKINLAFYSHYSRADLPDFSLDDKFVFSYTCSIYKAEMGSSSEDYQRNIRLVARYVEDNQYDKSASGDDVLPTKLSDDKIRINLSIVRVEDYSTPNGEKDTYNGYGAVSLAEIRQIFTQRGIDKEDNSAGIIQFEYTKDAGSGKTETVTIGSFTDNTNMCAMAFNPK